MLYSNKLEIETIQLDRLNMHKYTRSKILWKEKSSTQSVFHNAIRKMRTEVLLWKYAVTEIEMFLIFVVILYNGGFLWGSHLFSFRQLSINKLLIMVNNAQSRIARRYPREKDHILQIIARICNREGDPSLLPCSIWPGKIAPHFFYPIIIDTENSFARIRTYY